MKYIFLHKKLRSSLLTALVNFIGMSASAQVVYQPYSYQFYQKLNTDLYAVSSDGHTALKPLFVDDSLLMRHYDSLMNYGTGGNQNNAAYRKLFNEHLIDYRGENSTFYTDILPDLSVGRDFSNKITTNTASIGLQVGGTAGHKFYYYVSAYENTAVFPEYISTYINQVGIIPGQGTANSNGGNSYQWWYITAIVSYTPSKYLNLTAGRDKTFIGDGYRSMLLSDYASPYPFFKLTGTLGPLQYMAMWTYMNDPASTSQLGIDRKKFGVFHYIDWNVNKRLSFGFFENLIGFFTDDNGVKRPFDFNYINPLIILNPINNASDDPDKSLLGFTGKYKISNGVTVYGQFALNEFRSKDFFSNDGAFTNKFGWQLGLRGANLFAVKNLNFLIEANAAKPYTYQARSAIENYSDNGEPLAHPWGANFRELVGLLNYTVKRFDFSAEADFGRYGLDENGLNYGKNIFDLYTSPAKGLGNYIAQGLVTDMGYFEGKAAYVLNPKYNLRIEIGGLYRVEENTKFTDRTGMLTIALKSSFRQVYNDIASFKSH